MIIAIIILIVMWVNPQAIDTALNVLMDSYNNHWETVKNTGAQISAILFLAAIAIYALMSWAGANRRENPGMYRLLRRVAGVIALIWVALMLLTPEIVLGTFLVLILTIVTALVYASVARYRRRAHAHGQYNVMGGNILWTIVWLAIV